MELKKIPKDSVAAALARARHYRVLNEPHQAESICIDILEVESSHQETLQTLILALSDQFERRLPSRFRRAMEVLARLESEYDRHYYGGIINERRARAQLRRGGARVGPAAREWLDKAMDCYERAAELADPSNADPLLRYNTCVRMVEERAELSHEELSTSTAPIMLE